MIYFILCAFLSMGIYSTMHFFGHEDSDEIWGLIKTLSPGLFFGLAILLSSNQKIAKFKSIQFLVLLIGIWYATLIIGFNAYYLLTVPVAGILGTYAIGKAMDYILDKQSKELTTDMGIGLLAGMAGAFCFMFLQDLFDGHLTFGFQMSFILLFWQLAIGYRIVNTYKTSY
jgi:hypothetical protein